MHSLRALRHRDYRIFLFGQGLAMIGTWCQRVAVAWLVYRTTGSALLLGIAAFAGEICFLLIAPFGGLIADRVQRVRALIVVEAVSSAQAFTLAMLVWLGWADFGWIVALSLLLGACQAIEMPLRQAMFSDLIDDQRDLPNAVALMAFMNNAGRLIGPTIAGFAIGFAGEQVCFAINGFGYLFVIAALLRLRRPIARARRPGGSLWVEMRAGFGYAWSFPPIRATLELLATVSFCYLPYLVIVPVLTRDVLHADARALGFLLSSAGLGAVGGLFWIASAADVRTFPPLLAISGFVGAVGTLLLAFSSSFVPALAAMALLGFGIVVTATASNVYLQTISAPEKLGRVLGLFTMCFLGIAPFGNLIAGFLIEQLGCRITLVILGALGIAGAGRFQFNRRRIASRADAVPT